MNRLLGSSCIGFALVTGACGAAEATIASARPNVLFISVDDLNDWVGCLNGHPQAYTPNFDRLARRGLLFTRAQCVSPVCCPSRAAVFSGVRPETSGIYSNARGHTIHEMRPDLVLIPQYFRQQGYRVLGTGKLLHPMGNVLPSAFDDFGPGSVVCSPFTNEECAQEKQRPTFSVDRGPGKLKAVLPLNGMPQSDRPNNRLAAHDWGPVDVTDDEMSDGEVANWAIEQLRRPHDRPWFLGVGFYRPHQPLFAPRPYFERFVGREVELPPHIAGDLDDLPRSARDLALLPFTSGRHETVLKYQVWQSGVAAYLACVSFVDALLGRVVDTLDASPSATNTWIVLWSDHGWHLGEKEHWGKYTAWERAARVPLIIVPPREAAPGGFVPGEQCERVVSLLDLFPTLIEACGFPELPHLEGTSLLPLLRDPDRNWPGVAVTTVGRGTASVRTERWRYTRYYDGSEELYDTTTDPDEFKNLAGQSGYDSRKRDLAQHLPVDPRFHRFVRMGEWKAIYPADGGRPLLYRMGPEGANIGEEKDRAAELPSVINRMNHWLVSQRVSARHVTIPVE